MAYKKNGLSHLFKFFKFMVAFCLEENVTYRQSLVHDQDFRVNINSHCKSQPHEHTAGIGLCRLINIISNIRKA